jgi:hypothetical protein
VETWDGKGTFGIRQRDSGWYGIGSDNFLKEITRCSQRYKGYKRHIDHSEELAFFDELNDGLFLLSARQSMTREALIHSVEVIVRLRGIPVNTQPYVKFVRSFTCLIRTGIALLANLYFTVIDLCPLYRYLVEVDFEVPTVSKRYKHFIDADRRAQFGRSPGTNLVA